MEKIIFIIIISGFLVGCDYQESESMSLTYGSEDQVQVEKYIAMAEVQSREVDTTDPVVYYNALREEYLQSSLFFHDGAVISSLEQTKDNEAELIKLKVANLALGKSPNKLPIPDGTKVLVFAEDGNIVVSFEKKLNDGDMGWHYLYQVVLDSTNANLINMKVGG